MKLLTKRLEKRFAKVGNQEQVKDPIVICKFFNPTGRDSWFATEYYPKPQLFFGYVSLFGDHCDKWGYFSLAELESYKGTFGLGVERDRHFPEQPISKVIEEIER